MRTGLGAGGGDEWASAFAANLLLEGLRVGRSNNAPLNDSSGNTPVVEEIRLRRFPDGAFVGLKGNSARVSLAAFAAFAAFAGVDLGGVLSIQ